MVGILTVKEMRFGMRLGQMFRVQVMFRRNIS